MSDYKITKQTIYDIRAELECSLLEAHTIARQRIREVAVNQLDQRINALPFDPDHVYEIRGILQDMLDLIK